MKNNDSIEFIFYLGPIVKCITLSILTLWGLAIIPCVITKSWFFWDWGWYWASFYLVTSMIPILGFVEDCVWNVYSDKNCNLETFRRDLTKVEEVFDMPDKIHKKFKPFFNFFLFLWLDFALTSSMIFIYYFCLMWLAYGKAPVWAFWESKNYGFFPELVFGGLVFMMTILSLVMSWNILSDDDESTDDKSTDDKVVKQ